MANKTQATYVGHPDHMSNVINSQCAWERKCLAKARETNWVAEFGPEPSEAVVNAAFANSTEAWAVLKAWKEQAAVAEKIHVFEAAGLGKAPFRFVGEVGQEMAYGQRVLANGCTTKPGGTCEYCGTYIVNMFRIESADGRTFVVGCDCLRKTGDAGLLKVVKEAERARRQIKAREKRERVYRECQSEHEWFETVREAAVKLPHPDDRCAAKGMTMADYADFCYRYAGHAKALQVFRMIRKQIG